VRDFGPPHIKCRLKRIVSRFSGGPEESSERACLSRRREEVHEEKKANVEAAATIRIILLHKGMAMLLAVQGTRQENRRRKYERKESDFTNDPEWLAPRLNGLNKLDIF
jgi:hypothetical protein